MTICKYIPFACNLTLARFEREDARKQAEIDWQMKKTKAIMEKQRAMETWLLAKRRARIGGGGKVEVPEILRKRELTAEEKAQKRAPELFRAVQSGNTLNVTKLINAGVNANVKDINNWTPLHHACIRGFSGIVGVLLRAGADVEALTKDRKSAFELAQVAGYDKIMTLIRQKLSNEALVDKLTDDELVLINSLFKDNISIDKSENVIYKGNRGYDPLAATITDKIFLGRHQEVKMLVPSNPLSVEWNVLLSFISNFLLNLGADKQSKSIALAKIAKAKGRIKERKNMENIEQFKPIENSDTHISLRPTGYAFPLLSTFVERERDMNTTYGLIPNGMNESENLLRTLDKMSRNEVGNNGKRQRLNPIAKLSKNKKKKMLRNLYLHDIHNNKMPKVKRIKTITADDWLGVEKKKKKRTSWIDLQSRNTKYKERKLELMIYNLHEAQVDDAKQMKKIKEIRDTKFKTEMYTYAAMKNAQKQDKLLELMDDADMLTLPQEINYLIKSKKIDEGMAYKFSKETF